MAFRRSNILNQIAQGGNASPITAFLVGRENKRQRERQENRDAQLDTQFGQQSELNTLKIDAIKGEPARIKADRERLAAEQQQQTSLINDALQEAEGLTDNQRSVLMKLNEAGRQEDVVKALTALDKDAGSPFTLSRDQLRFDANNKIVARGIESPAGSGDGKPSAAEEKIARLESIGLTPEQAIGVADGSIKMDQDPSGGVIRLTDIGKALRGEDDAVIELNIQPAGGEVPFPSIPQEQSLFSQRGEATGPTNIIQNSLSKISGAIGGPIDERTVAATQYFAAAENTVIRAFSLNKRYPITEQNRIKANIGIAPKFFDSEELMGIRMKSIDSFLEQEQKMAEYFAAQPGASRDQRTADRATANGIIQFREQLKVPSGGDSSNEAPSGVDPTVWQAMTPEERALWD